MDLLSLNKILNDNSDKNFVRRILYPENYPVLRNGENGIKTHLMSYAEDNGNFYVYPQVAFDSGKLFDLGKDAYDYAMKNRQFIKFDNEEDAKDFSKNYKQYWNEIGFDPSSIKDIRE